MANLTSTIAELEARRASIDRALKVLRSLKAGGAAVGGTRIISPEGRAKIAAAQRRRWAKVRAAKKAEK